MATALALSLILLPAHGRRWCHQSLDRDWFWEIGAEYLGVPSIKGLGFTPFLDKMVTDGQEQGTLLFFDRAFSVNGRRSIEGIAAIYAGIPSMMDEPFIQANLAQIIS